MSDKVVEFNKDNFEDEVIKSEVPVLVDFWAAWCVPCKMIAPTVQELAEEYGEKLKFGKVNVDENREISGRFGIRGIPSLLLFKDGKVLEQMVGLLLKVAEAAMKDGKAIGICLMSDGAWLTKKGQKNPAHETFLRLMEGGADATVYQEHLKAWVLNEVNET